MRCSPLHATEPAAVLRLPSDGSNCLDLIANPAQTSVMPKHKRGIVGGMVYPVMNRGNGRATIFENDADLKALRRSAGRGRPYGDPDWQRQTARRLGLQCTLRPPGRPRKESPR